MSGQHIIAIDTYGAQRVTDPTTGKTVSAYKLGYTTAVTDVLLALYGAKARDVSPRHASYRYVQIDGEVLVRHGHILLTLTPSELEMVEGITRQHHRAAVFLWRDERWWALPDSSHDMYTEPGYGVGPKLAPTGLRPPSPSTGERVSASAAITVERSEREAGGQVWHWINGDTYPHRELLKAHGARWSKKRQAWYWVGAELPATIRALTTREKQPPSALTRFADQFAAPVTIPPMPPELAAMIEQVLADDDHAQSVPPLTVPQVTEEEPPAPPAVRILNAVPMPADGEPLDAVQSAIQEVRSQTLDAPAASVLNGRIARIDQSFVGELTGSITGQIFCYGYALHDGVCVYVNMAGPRVGVEAIRAKLSKGQIVSVVPSDGPSVELTAGEGNMGMYHPYLHYLPEARFASLILVHDHAIMPNHGGKSTTFIFRTSDAQATAKLKQHVTQLVNIPVFEAWSAYLYEAGQRAMLVHKCRSAGGIDLLAVDLDGDAWTRLVTGGLEQGVIALPS